MQIQLGAHVRTSDGHRLGEIKRVVWDPETNEVRDFVVSTGGLIGHDVLISREVIERASVGTDEIAVDLTKDELNGLEHYADANFAPPPYGWMAPASYTYPIASYLFPMDPAAVPLAAPTNDDAASRPRRPTIKKGMPVKDPEGKTVGQVTEVRIDDMTGELRSIVVEEQGAAGIANASTFEVPADHFDVGAGEIQLMADARGTQTTKRDEV